MKIIAALATASAALLAAAPAQAVTFAFVSAGHGTIAPGYTLFNDFNAQTGLTGSGFSYYTTNVGGEGAMPAGSDGSTYVAVKNGGKATATFNAAVKSFSLYLGSIDATNRITLNYGDGSRESVLGTMLTALHDGNQVSAQNNGLFTFTGATGKTISSITLGSNQNSFEFDDLAVKGAVPEPATWGLMILGFGLVGSQARRRRHQAVVA